METAPEARFKLVKRLAAVAIEEEIDELDDLNEVVAFSAWSVYSYSSRYEFAATFGCPLKRGQICLTDTHWGLCSQEVTDRDQVEK